MSRQQHVDVLVVGLGPAGASAAIAAAQAGLKVLGVDRKRRLGEPVQCAEWIPLPLAKHAQGQGVRLQGIQGMRSNLPSGEQAHSSVPGLVVDRAAFDRALAEQAQAAGAEIRCSTQFMGLESGNSVALFSAGNEEFAVAFHLLIAADGPYSPIAHELGLPPLEVVHTRQYTVPLLQSCSDTEVWLSDAYPGGYAWLFPKGDWANLGLGAERHLLEDLKQPLDALHQQLIAQGRVGSDIIHRTGGAIPVGGLREKLVVGNTLFVGDAAGFTHPVTGAGIAAAVASGERAGQAAGAYLALSQAQALAEFEQDMREQFEASLLRAVQQRRRQAHARASMPVLEAAAYRQGWIAFPEYFAEIV